MSVGKVQAFTAVVMAYAIMLILISPAVPSPLTTVRSKQMVHPPHLLAPVNVLLFTAVADPDRVWQDQQSSVAFNSGSDIVDLTTARLI